jgi:hypothetical protein
MRVYLHSDSAEKSAKYTVHISPGADASVVKEREHFPQEWWQPDGAAKQYMIDFAFGAADVPDPIGNYLVLIGLAHRTRLVRRIRQLFDAAGNAVTELFDDKGRSVAVQAPAE